MEFKVNQSDLLYGMKAIEKNSMTLTKTGLVQLQITDVAPHTLQVSAQDETGLTVSTAVSLNDEVRYGGTLYVKYNVMRDMAKTLREGEITFTTGADDNGGKLDYAVGNQSGRIATMDAAKSKWKYSEDSRGQLLNEFTVSGNVLRRMIQGSVYAVSTDDDVRPFLNGILVEVRGDAVTCVGCDGFRMAVVPTDRARVEKSGKDCNAIMSMTMAKTLLKQLPKPTKRATKGPEAPAIIRVFENGLTVNYGSVSVAGATIPGEYIAYRTFIPKGSAIKANLREQDVANMLDTVSRLQPVAGRSDQRCVHFAFTEEGFTVSAYAEDMAVSEDVPAAVEMDDSERFRIALNPNYLIDVLKNTDTTSGAKLGMTTSTCPFLVEPRDTVTPGEVHMILPILTGRAS